MTDDIMLTIGDDGTASLYDDTYDITIHCESQEEQDEVKRILENIPHWIPVTERLPYAEYGESDNVLATCGHRDVEDGNIRWIKTLYFNGGNWCFISMAVTGVIQQERHIWRRCTHGCHSPNLTRG